MIRGTNGNKRSPGWAGAKAKKKKDVFCHSGRAQKERFLKRATCTERKKAMKKGGTI